MKEEIAAKCQSCGAELYFNPEGNNLKCRACGTVVEFEKTGTFDKRTVDLETLTTIGDKIDDSRAALSRCGSCGASFTGTVMTLSTKCQYCGGNMVVDDAAAHPDACIPFAFGKEAASQKFAEEIKKKFFVPKALKKNPKPDSIESIYIPAFSFSSRIAADYAGELYEVYTDSDGDSHRRHFNIRGTEHADLKDVLIECSDYMTQSELKQIEPYYMNETKKFSQAFVYGYSVEYYNRTVEDSAKLAREIMQERVRKQILKGYDHDGVDYLDIKYKYGTSTYSYLLLPTYRVNFKYKKKDYSAVMNGQTGKIGGKLPSTPWRVVGIILLFIAFFAVIFWLIVAGELDEIFQYIDF